MDELLKKYQEIKLEIKLLEAEIKDEAEEKASEAKEVV